MVRETSKIRVALIGLSASAKVSWAADAHLPYLLSPRGSSHYELVALLNSSVAAAIAARTHYKLPSTIKTYGDPSTLAADPDIDLVICNTRVDVHSPTVTPSLRAGKAAFVEWPLTEDLASAIALTKGEKIPDSIVGLQGRVSVLVLRVKQLLASGVIGRVYNSEVQSYGNLLQRDSMPDSLSYFADRKIGGHQINIPYGHLIDFVHEVLGEFEEGGFQARMQIQRPELKIKDAKGKEKGVIKSDVPDYLAIHGTLVQGKRSADIVDGAVLVATFRHGQQFKGQPGFVWTINGEKGELRVSAPGPYTSDSYGGEVIELHDHATDEVRDVGWDWEDWQKELPMRARNAAVLFERYAEWVENGRPDEVPDGKEWPRLHDGVERMKEFDALYKQFDETW